ncbi:MAG TPA: M50 family metallopeptidase [Candidatus Angelobacter sp.]|nr:M50 family metallopeptidase [Candidatus Angelobacter sp.]
MELVFGIIIGFIILVILVALHEFGHALQARRSGVVVEEFGIGFPPRAWKKKLKNGILFTINWLPLGGFAKLQGENDSANKKGDYGAVSFFQKTKILLAGVVVNWFIAVILLSVLAFTGLPKILPNQISIPSDTTIISQPVEIATLTKDYPAENAGLKIGDTIIRFAGQEVPTVDNLSEAITQNKGKEVTVIYNREGLEQSASVTLKNDANDEIFGAGLGKREIIKTTWSAPIVGVATTAQFTWATIQGIGELVGSLVRGLVLQLSPDASVREQASSELKTVGDEVAGPIGIVGTIFPAAQQAGLTQIVFLTAVLSLSLAVMNVLPIPVLDGGRWFMMAIFRLLKKKLTLEREEKIQTVGLSILMGLVILVTFADVTKLF